MKTYTTKEIAKLMGLHPNTVMLYEKWGYIGLVERKENGYRIYTDRHLALMQLVQLVLSADWIKYELRLEAREIIRSAASGHLDLALGLSQSYLRHLQAERQRETLLMTELEKIMSSDLVADGVLLSRSKAAMHTGLSVNVLVNWERYGLIVVPRQSNGYRQYGPAEFRRIRAIELLRKANYRTQCIGSVLNQLETGKTDINLMAEAEASAEALIVHINNMILLNVVSNKI